MLNRADALQAIEVWLSGLDGIAERLSADDRLLTAQVPDGWSLKSQFGHLALLLDADFPYSRTVVYWLDFDQSDPKPHVEREGKLCLRTPVLPQEPLRSVQAALREGIRLLRSNSKQLLDADFNEDFDAYWNYYASADVSGLLIPDTDESYFGSGISTSARRYAFKDKNSARRWWQNLGGDFIRKLPRTAVIRLSSLPTPRQFPATVEDLRWLIEKRSTDGLDYLKTIIRQVPKTALVICVAPDSTGRQRSFSCLLSRPLNIKKPGFAHWKTITHGLKRKDAPTELLYSGYTLTRLRSEFLDGALSRIPDVNVKKLASSKVAIVGCGALGSGVARLIAQAGVGNLLLIDPEPVGWENIRRHELGAGQVGLSKAESLSDAIRMRIPDMRSVDFRALSMSELIRSEPKIFSDVDLVVSATGDFSADILLSDLQIEKMLPKPVVFTWLEAYAVAAHAVLIEGEKYHFGDGFDGDGQFKLPVSENTKPPPIECGGATTPFGAIDLHYAQAMAANLTLERIRGNAAPGEWHTWISSERTLVESGGNWSEKWSNTRGKPFKLGGISDGKWEFG